MSEPTTNVSPLVRMLHLALYTDASRRGNASWSAIAGFAVTVFVGMVMLVAASPPLRRRGEQGDAADARLRYHSSPRGLPPPVSANGRPGIYCRRAIPDLLARGRGKREQREVSHAVEYA